VSRGCGVALAVAIGLALPICGIVAGVATRSTEGFLFAFMVPVVVIGFGAILWQAFRRERVRREGVLVSASVVSVARIDFEVGTEPRYDVTYRYVDREGLEHVGTSRLVRVMPRDDESHTIRYDPDDPASSVWIS
jgi:uncharacterized protein DUF3592